MNDKHVARYGSAWVPDTNNPLYNLLVIYADEASDLWEVFQQMYDGRSPSAASDVLLDNTAAIVNVNRLEEEPSTVVIEFTGTVGTVVASGTALKVTNTDARFFTDQALTLSSSIFSQVVISLVGVVDSTNYTVTIDSVPYTYNSGIGATTSSILAGLAGVINLGSNGCDASYTTTLLVNVTEDNSTLPLALSGNLVVTTVSNLVTASSEFVGQVKAPAGSLTATLVPISGISSVTNLQDAVLGRIEETDEELRIRRYDSVASTGSANFNALLSKVRNLDGVKFTALRANTGASTNSDGLPSKAFEFTIEGGDEQEIAETIFVNQPWAIESYGDVSRVVTDIDGNPQTVKFSRPTNIYIHVLCEYEAYGEETAQLLVNEAIANSILNTGNKISVGGDVIPTRFLGDIYSKTSGVGKVTISLSKSLDGSTTLIPFTTDTLELGVKEKPVFRIDLISVLRV